MILLAIETSGDPCSVAVSKDGVVIAETRFEHERRLAERLPEMIEATCLEARVDLPDVSVLAAGIGPGSFTGVRVAVATTKAWAWGSGLPVIGVPGFEAMAESLGSERAMVGLAPCRRGEAIVWLGADDYRVLALDSVVESVREQLGTGAVLAFGEAARWLIPVPQWDVLPRGPWASEIARSAHRRWMEGARPGPGELAPLYGAPPPIREGLVP